ncbi:MAG: PAS domain S-box protein [Candidatus Hydrogenedens sp.]
MSTLKIRDVIQLLKNSTVSFLICSADGTIEYCDKETKRRLIGSVRGIKLETHLLNEFVEVCYPRGENIIPSSSQYWMQIWKKRIQKKNRSSSTDNWGSFGIHIKDEKSNLHKILFFIYPITDEKLLDTLLEEDAHILKILEHFSILVIQINSSGEVLYVNEYIKNLTGWLPSEVLGKNWFETFVPDEICEETIQFFQANRLKTNTNDILFEGEIVTKDKKKLLMLWACFPVKQGQGVQSMLILGQELSTPHREKFFMRGIRVIKNQFHWLCGDLVHGIPEEEAFSKILHSAIEITSMEAGAIFKLNPREITLVSAEGLEDKITKLLQHVPKNNLVIETIFSSNDVIEISSMVDSFPVNLRERGFAKIFAIPIRTSENPVGCVVLATTRKDMLDGEIIPLLNSISCEVGWLFLWYEVLELQRRQGRQYELLEQMLPYALLSVDETGEIIGINRGGIRLLGADYEEELLKNKIQRFIPNWYEWVNKLGQNEEIKTSDIQEIEIENLKGERIPTEFIVGHFLLASRSFYMVFLRDVRWRKQAIETIQKAEERYKELFENANDIVYTHDLTGRFTSLNKAGIHITGYSLEEALNMNAFDILAPEYHNEVKEQIRKKLAGAPPTKYEVEIIAKDGHRIPLEVSTRLIYEKEKPVGIQGIARDITDRRRAEEERKRLEMQILYAQKLESLGVLAGGIAHDYNNILVGILGNAELALARLPDDSPIRTYLKRIEESAQRAAELTNQMLAYSGKGVIATRPLNLSRLVEEMKPLLSAIVSKKAIVEYDCPDNLPSIHGDAIQLHQVLMNLITNASESLGESPGKIVIQIKVVDLTREHIKESYYFEPVEPGKYICLEVSDTGSGMSKEVIPRIFDPFFSTKFAGRGLGLASVLGIVRGHKGTINVYSEPGKGTCFKVYFPVSETIKKEEMVQEEEQKKYEKEMFETGKISSAILVVDDEESVLEVANESLTQFGYKTILARNGREALELFNKYKSELTAVVLDLTMPELDGLEVFQEIKKVNKNIPVILCSGFPEQDVHQRFEGIKPSGFIQKPYRPFDLIKLLKSVIGDTV